VQGSIRIATADDAAGILDCLQSAFAPVRDQYSDGAWQDTVLTPATIAERLLAMSVLVAVDAAGAIVGTIACQPVGGGEGHLRGMAVVPAGQGRGVAVALLAAAEATLRGAGCDRVSLDTTAPLLRAVRFYQRSGYRATGRVADYFGMALYEYEKRLSESR